MDGVGGGGFRGGWIWHIGLILLGVIVVAVAWFPGWWVAQTAFDMQYRVMKSAVAPAIVREVTGQAKEKEDMEMTVGEVTRSEVVPAQGWPGLGGGGTLGLLLILLAIIVIAAFWPRFWFF